ncbi:MAG: hypothetical protein ACE5H8_09540 [Alphaproteobacteria bacterium]
MTLYGLYGFTHGWGTLLTVMSPEGGSAARAAIEPGDDVTVVAGEGRLTQFYEKRAGALARLVAANGIVVLSKAEWDIKKAAFGDAIWR